jgi:GAF domain-containing protein
MQSPSKTKEALKQEISGLHQKIAELERSKAELKQAEHHQSLAAQILDILNNPDGLTDSISTILAVIKRETGFDAVGIRLRSGDDFPYFDQKGFSHDFLLAENSLVARDSSGGVCRDKTGKISLECTCGLVISGKTDTRNPLCTEGGSVWTNNSLSLLELRSEQDPRLHPRNNCIHRGYMSVALIPIKARGGIVGLLQLNDREKDRFTLDTIRFFEGIGASIGVALLRKQEEEERNRLIAELKEALSNVRILSGLLPICAACKKIRDDKGYWNQIEAYIKEHSSADFSHSICPDCAQKLYPELFKKSD